MPEHVKMTHKLGTKVDLILTSLAAVNWRVWRKLPGRETERWRQYCACRL